MEVSTKDLRSQLGKIIRRVEKGLEVTITYRGRPVARLVPITGEPEKGGQLEDEVFGMWQDRDPSLSVDEIVRDIRKGRAF